MADEQKGTAYVVLRLVPQDGEVPQQWLEVATADGSEAERFMAANDIAAIKAAEKATGQKFDHGAVAVPARSWRPRVPKDEMVPRRLWQ